MQRDRHGVEVVGTARASPGAPRLDLSGYPEDRPAPDPAIETAAVVADKEAIALARLHQVQVLVAAAAHQNDVADVRIARAERRHGHLVCIIDPSGH